jgi:phosphoribosylamine---glycine ligase
MNILVIGSGAREHALTWKCKQSNLVKNIYTTPGNAGIQEISECINANILDFNSIEKIVKEKKIDLIIVGPEAPLSMGITDYFTKKGIPTFGPDLFCSQFESSKVFTKNFLKKHNIPTAEFETFTDTTKALKYVEYLTSQYGYPVVIKADGLAAGKGVVIAQNADEARETINDMMVKNIFGNSGKQVVIEQFLDGVEASIHLVISGENYLVLPSSQDHKRIFDNDLGPNTGGMGAYSPCPLINEKMISKIETQIIQPLISAFKKDSINYKGILYIGLMIIKGEPMILEFNVRLGDPETQVLLPLIKTDFIDIALNTVKNSLSKINLGLYNQHAVCVVCASKGYPGDYEKNKIITGLEYFKNKNDVLLFHAGTSKNNKNEIITSGGRVLSVVGLGKNLEDAIKLTYDSIQKIHFDGMQYRKDIAKKAFLIEK